MKIDKILALPLTERKEWFDKAKNTYYETSNPIMSDDDYDLLEESITNEEEDSYYVGSNSRHNKAEHRNKMLSLKKLNISIDSSNTTEILRQAWDRLSEQNLTASLKYDGLAMNVEFENSTLKQIVSRGNGFKGVDRTTKLRHIIDNSPEWQQFIKTNVTGEVRCECVMTYADFLKYYEPNGYEHPRNAASGLVSDEKDPNSAQHLKLIALEGISSTGLVMPEELIQTLPNHRTAITDITSFEEFQTAYYELSEIRKTYGIPLDGLVISQSKVFKFEHDGKYPNHAICIKWASPTFESEITDIQWNLQKTGRYVPKLFFKPVEVEGRQIKRCSGHNLEYLVRNGIELGSTIKFKLSGEIIPCIVR